MKGTVLAVILCANAAIAAVQMSPSAPASSSERSPRQTVQTAPLTFPLPRGVTPPVHVQGPPCNLTGHGPRPQPLAGGHLRTTVASYVVTVEGTVRDVTVLQSSGSSDLDDAVVACARSWRFKPALELGVPVEVLLKVQVPWSFRQP